MRVPSVERVRNNNNNKSGLADYDDDDDDDGNRSIVMAVAVAVVTAQREIMPTFLCVFIILKCRILHEVVGL